jgi:hypothetical protein
MVVGFNHNVRYQGEVFHVQTEDGGLNHPHIITLLYRGGTILASRKSSYADITKADGLEQVVEELMKEQHKEMLRRLKAGDFDELIAGRKAPAPAPNETLSGEKAGAASPVPEAPSVLSAPIPPEPPVMVEAEVEAQPAPRESVPLPAPPAPDPAASKSPPLSAAVEREPAAATPAENPTPEPGAGLDDIILAYLVGNDGK